MRFPVRAIVPTSLIVLAALAAFFVSHQPRADASVLVVTKTTDTADGTCSIADCSLREAVIVANAASGADTITLPAGTYQLTIGGGWENASAAGDLDITNDVTINGGGAATTIIDAGDLDRVLSVFSGTANVFGVTMRNGTGDYGGGVYVAQGGTLNLTNVTVSGNTVFGFAAGIYNTGNMTLTNSTVSGNFTGNQTGGVCNCFSSTMTITNSTISGNSAGSIGGLYNYNGSTLTVTGSTISGNTANFIGGINNGSGNMTMTNSTVSGNTSTGTAGGIYTEANTSLINVTITNNTADSDGDGSGDGGGIYVPWWASANLKNTIIAGNADLSAVTVEPDCHTSTENGGIGLTSQGFNLIQNLAGCTISGDTTGNVTGLSANLAPLANNGGQTWTHALLLGSPAIDAVTAGCPPPTTDQRGVTRPKGNDDCDIGSYESPYSGPLPTPTPSPSPTPSVTPTPTASPTPTAAPSGTSTTTPTPTGTPGGPTPTPTTGIPTPTPTPSPTASPGGPLQGDVDCNEVVDSVDSLKVLRYVAGLPVVQNEPCTDIGVGMPGFAAHGGQHLQGDVDCGGDVSSVDALKVLRYVASMAVAQSEPCTDVGTNG